MTPTEELVLINLKDKLYKTIDTMLANWSDTSIEELQTVIETLNTVLAMMACFN